MKKLFLMIAVAALSAQTMSAQTVEESKNFDNWYIGINGGVTAPAKNFKVLKNMNFDAGLRIGRWFTPVVGLAAEGEVYFGKKVANTYLAPLNFENIKTTVKMTNVSLLGTLNLSNWLGGYPGQPRTFEVIGVAGLGWLHYWGQMKENAMSSKLAVDFTFNLGSDKQWQIYVEPNIVYSIADSYIEPQFNLNRANIGANLGINYKFGNSNGTHNFKIAELRDQAEIDALNAKINELRANLNDKDALLAAKDAQIRDLQAALDACNNRPTEPVYVKPATATNLQPTVLFRKGKSVIDAAQYAPIELIASYMKNHPEAKVEIKGYASPEGPADLNQKLSEDRANAVMKALIKKYKISADRLTAVGCGVTDQLFEELEFNRVATFNDSAK